MSQLYTVVATQKIEWVEKNSRFIAIINRCDSIRSFESIHSQLKIQYGDANHIVYAYTILDDAMLRIKCFDDGEPSGTAGRPILAHLKGKDLVNVAIFVVRYFGGIKLGAGGLVRAYSHSARLAIEAATLLTLKDTIPLKVSIPYQQQKYFEYQLNKLNGSIIFVTYDSQITYTLNLNADTYEAFVELFPKARKL